MLNPIILKWEEPNRAKTPPLHIADRGARYSSLTGVTWLNDFQCLVAHRSGLRMALFDIRNTPHCLDTFTLPHLTDDIASKRIGSNTWEVTVTGCWDAIISSYELEMGIRPLMTFKETKAHTERTFSHGVRYDTVGNLCIALHTGADPRIELGDNVYRLPHPWGARCVCYFDRTKTYFAIAVSANPKLEQYKHTTTSIWSLDKSTSDWQMRFTIDGTHSDACEVYQNRIWLPDQKLDRVLGICLENRQKPIILSGKCFDFPHGLSISPAGTLAVTNYGNSSVVLMDLNEVIQAHAESHQNH